MKTGGVLFLISMGLLILSPLVLMYAKAHFHFQYLKTIFPEELQKYANIIETSRDRILYNKYAVLFLPFFKRYTDKETTPETKKLAQKVTLYIRLLYFDILFITIFLISIVLLFGHFWNFYGIIWPK